MFNDRHFRSCPDCGYGPIYDNSLQYCPSCSQTLDPPYEPGMTSSIILALRRGLADFPQDMDAIIRDMAARILNEQKKPPK